MHLHILESLCLRLDLFSIIIEEINLIFNISDETQKSLRLFLHYEKLKIRSHYSSIEAVSVTSYNLPMRENAF